MHDATRRGVAALAALVALVVAACAAPGDAGAVRATSPASPASPAMDGALAVELERFRASLPRTDTLGHALPSRDALVRTFVSALARADTLALVRLHVSRAEWAWLVYPGSRFTRPPYRQRPDVAWMLRIEPSNVGLSRLVARRGGRVMRLVRWSCSDSAVVDGAVREWGGCSVTYVSGGGEPRTERLFGSILERDGRFKIGGYANQF